MSRLSDWWSDHRNRENAFMIGATLFLAVVFGLWDHRKKQKGLSAGRSPEEFDPAELKAGIEVEMEHTDDREEARRIAMDHLVEDPRYYTKLKKIGL